MQRIDSASVRRLDPQLAGALKILLKRMADGSPSADPASSRFLVAPCPPGLPLRYRRHPASMIFNFVPIVKVPRAGLFAFKVYLAAFATNLIGVAIYWRRTRIEARANPARHI
jgi:hypothetical protein